MAAPYGCSALDSFSAVFDVDLFKRDIDRYFFKLLTAKNSTSVEALALLKNRGIEPTFRVKFKAIYWPKFKDEIRTNGGFFV